MTDKKKDIDKNTIKGYLWQEVVRLGFCPDKNKQKDWLRQYMYSLHKFFGLDSYPALPSQSERPPAITFEYELPYFLLVKGSFENADKFAITFFYLPPSADEYLIWNHDMDGTYFTFPVQKFMIHHNQRKQALRKFSSADMKEVLDGLIFHPAVHQHIKSPIDNHRIRIGGGIGNPFQFLFHLRYQFCLIEATRSAEEKRLLDLFSEAVEKNTEIPISKLMAHPIPGPKPNPMQAEL
jgi:hypothetical protein